MGEAGRDHLSVRAYGASPGSHDHTHFQILVGLEGVLELEVEGRGRRLLQGQGCVIAPGDRHDFEGRGATRCLVLDSHHDGWARAQATPPPGVPALARYLVEALSAPWPRAREVGAALLLEAWSPPASACAPAAATARRPIDWAALSRWLAPRLDAPLGVADLAARVHLSASQFNARCQAEQGLSPMQWLRLQRLTQARAWRAQGMGVAEAARRAGYRSPSAFTAALRRASA